MFSQAHKTNTKQTTIPLSDHAAVSLMSNTLLTPFRACLNGAASTIHPIQTLIEVTPRILKGASANIARGTIALTSQTYVKDAVKESFAEHTFSTDLLACSAAAIPGAAVGSTLEMYYVRKQVGIPGLRFSAPLTGMLLAREGAFAAYLMMDTSKFTQPQKYAFEFGMTALSAACHRQVVLYAKADNKASFFSPKKAVIALPNMQARLLNAGNMLLFRWVYLKACKEIMNVNQQVIWPEIKNAMR